MYEISTYIWLHFIINVRRYTSPRNPMCIGHFRIDIQIMHDDDGAPCYSAKPVLGSVDAYTPGRDGPPDRFLCINGVISYITPTISKGYFIPVTHLFSAIYRLYWHPIYNDGIREPSCGIHGRPKLSEVVGIRFLEAMGFRMNGRPL